MKQAFVPGLLEGIAFPGLAVKKTPVFESTTRPINFDAAEIAAAAAIHAMRSKRRGVK